MKRLILTLIVLAVAFIWAPQVLESATNSCDALEQKMVAKEVSGNDLGAALVQNLSGGTIAEQVVKEKHENLPPMIGCSLEYWKHTLGIE
jgi:hypothetical protein